MLVKGALETGTRVGSYEVLELLGAGGMGEVWRARDTRLGREVAIKVLPAALAGDGGRQARLSREAKVLAALNHPAIATIHGLEQVGGIPLLVMELVEGPTLAERLRRGPLPVRDALLAAIHIAEALAAAHEKGIVHRDLKPSNIKLLAGGRLKVLDFGLAKMLGDQPLADEVSQVTTDTVPSAPGAVLGTAPYMSPEQARGEQVDERTDIWSFGCVLYEMLAGTRAFAGPSGADVTAAILEREPAWAALPPDTPATAHAVLRHCLRKDRSHRLRSAADVAIEIEDALVPSTLPVPSAAPGARSWLPTALVAVLALAIGIAAAWLWKTRAPARRDAALRFNIDVLPQMTQWTTRATFVAIAPDASNLVLEASGGLYLRPLDGTEWLAIRGAERGMQPFFSPDGRWIGFQANGKLQKVPIGGGPARILGDAPSLRGASWADDGTITYAPINEGGLFRVSAEGGAAQKLTEPRPLESHRWPQVLPGGAVLYTRCAHTGRAEDCRIAVLSVAGKQKVLVEGGTYGRYVPTGHLLYAVGGTVFAAPFDVERLALTGPALPVLRDVRMQHVGPAHASLDFSRTGVLVYVTPFPQPRRAVLLRVDRSGSATPLSDPRRGLLDFSLSPDGKALVAAVAEPDGLSSLWRYELANETWTQLTFGHLNVAPVWLPGGDRIVFSSDRLGTFKLFLMSADGGAAEPLAGVPPGWAFSSGWSADGRTLLFYHSNPQAGADLWELPLDGKAQARPLLATPRHEGEAQLSPDGKWIAYTEADRGGLPELYVRPYRGADRKWAVSGSARDSGSWACCPRWDSTSRELFYLAGRATGDASGRGHATMLTAVSVSPTASSFRVGLPRALFDRGKPLLAYTLMPDGRHFVIAEDVDEPERLSIVVVPGWFDELRTKVPGGRGTK